MSPPDSAASEASIARALHFIEDHLCEDMAVEDIAAQAALYSPFHFTRLFHSLAGDTPGGYLRKRRLSEAARELVETRRSVLQIALTYRFRSAEAFSRSFKRQFGLSPSDQRRSSSFLHLVDPVELPQVGPLSSLALEPRILAYGQLHFAGLVYHGDNANHELPAVWARLNPMIERIPHRAGPLSTVGIWQYPPSFQSGRDFDYTAAVQVTRPGPLPAGLSRKTLPPSRYAAFTHQGPLRLIRQTYVYIYAEWLPNSGFEQAAPFDLEVYDARFLGPNHPDAALDILIPLA